MGFITDSAPRALNELARHRMINRLLTDILVDMQVCDLEGWDKKEYITQLHKEIDRLYEKIKDK